MGLRAAYTPMDQHVAKTLTAHAESASAIASGSPGDEMGQQNSYTRLILDLCCPSTVRHVDAGGRTTFLAAARSPKEAGCTAETVV